MSRIYYSLLTVLVAITLSACGGGGGGGGGGDDDMPPPPPPANTQNYSVDLSTREVRGGGNASGSATAELTLDLDDNSLTGTVSLSGLDANSVNLNRGFAGETGTEIIVLVEDSSDTWSIPSDTELSDDQRIALDAGELFIRVTTSAEPDGAVRGQIIPDGIELIITDISQGQSIPPTGSSATAIGFITIDTDSGDIAARVITENFPDATIAHIHQAFAGLSGGILVNLSQDMNEDAFWSNSGNEETLDNDGLAALMAGQLYFNFHSAAFGAGEIRGQIEPQGIDISFTELVGDTVVMAGMTGVTTDASAVAAATVDLDTMQADIHINTVNLDDALSATLNQAPAGQNGPAITDFIQDGAQISLWSADDVQINNAEFAAFNNQGLYFTVNTPDFPDGEVRGQLIVDGSTMGSGDSFQVTAVNPANAAELEALPQNATITFNRNVLAGSLGMNTVSLTASGGDGSFGEANDVAITGVATSVNGDTITADFSGVGPVADDIFQLAIADNQLSDTTGVILDGDGDGEPGGIFSSTFNVVTPDDPTNPNATFSAIQQNIFTPICVECHGGGSPSAGMSLEAGQAFGNIVNVMSGQSSLLRIEPNNPDDSYLIRKLEGGPGIVGGRMPLGGPFLSQDTIDDIREWVSNGAENN